jgi:hypothetical protein
MALQLLTWQQAFEASDGGKKEEPNGATGDTYHWMANVLDTAQPKNRKQKACITGLLANVNKWRDIPGQRMSRQSQLLVDTALEAYAAKKAAAKANKENMSAAAQPKTASSKPKRTFQNRGPKTPLAELTAHLLKHNLTVTPRARGTVQRVCSRSPSNLEKKLSLPPSLAGGDGSPLSPVLS